MGLLLVYALVSAAQYLVLVKTRSAHLENALEAAILQGFRVAHAVAKTPLSSYNMSYFNPTGRALGTVQNFS